MFKKIAIFVFVLACYSGAANFTSTHGKLKVSGGKILDKNNNEIVLRGMSFFWYQWTDGSKFYTSAVVKSLADNWKVSLIRAALQTSDLAMAKSMMDWANTNGVYVIIDNHSHNAHSNQQAAVNFFRDVSAYVKQKNYTHVIYELYNEPITTPWSDIKKFAETVIDEIRKNDADGLIIVGTPGYSSDIASARASPITGTRAKNVLYTLHFYAATAGHSLYKNLLEGAYCNDFPIFVSEWGTSAADGNGTISTNNSNDWLSLLEAAKVSYVNWSITDKSESSAALASNNIDGSLTASGTYVKNILKLNTSGTTLAGVGLSAKTINCSSSEPTGPDGKIGIGANYKLANFFSKNGADSANASIGAVLENTSANFTANYNIVGIEKTGHYLIEFYAASSAGATVSWSGSGISSGTAQIANFGLNQFKYTEPQLIEIREKPQTPLQLDFKASSAKSLYAGWIYIHEADSADSVKYNISPISAQNFAGGKHWSYDAVAKTFIFEKNEGTLAIYNLRGERARIFAAQGKVSINVLASGTYIAVYRRGSETSRKTIFLK